MLEAVITTGANEEQCGKQTCEIAEYLCTFSTFINIMLVKSYELKPKTRVQ